MDDQKLAEQLAKTGNLMDLCVGDEWLNEIDDPEDDGWIEAGPRMRPYVEALKSVSPEAIRTMRRQMRIQSILMPELCQWLESWGLGLSFEAVYTEARRVVRRHLKQLTLEQEAWLDALVAEDDQHLPMAERALRSQVVALFSTLFTADDWQALAKIAAQDMAKGVLQVAEQAPPIAV
ncbi:MAG: hypothetical protein F6J97_01000 [Leptolyngbya sp. SIO4C1]|nr:hypothetical protein [Leptolyngbya sp. SIO4C1]